MDGSNTNKDFQGYFSYYIDKVKEHSLEGALVEGRNNVTNLLLNMSDEQLHHRYEDSKWSTLEVIVHMMDTERIMGYRAISFARGEKQHLPGFDQDDFVRNCDFSVYSRNSLLQEYKAVREGTIHLFRNLTKDEKSRYGSFSVNELDVSGLGYVIAGHELHHLNVIDEKYGIKQP